MKFKIMNMITNMITNSKPKLFKKYMAVLIVTVILLNTVYQVQSENVLIYETTTSETVTKGLTYEHKSKFTQSGWVDVHVLKMDLQEEQVALRVLESVGEQGVRGTLSSLVAQQEGQVVAGVNGSFFDMSKSVTEPIGPVIMDEVASGEHLYNNGADGAASLIQLDSGEILFDYIGLDIKFSNEFGIPLYIKGINKVINLNYPIVYNELFGTDTTQLDSLGEFYKVVIKGFTVVDIVEPLINVAIPKLEDGYIVAIPKENAEVHLKNLGIGMGVDLQINTTIDISAIKLAISGGGKIMENGLAVSEGLIVEATKRHPRTVIGLSADNRYLIAMVVDGRGSSIGASYSELISYLKEYNVSDAVNFDGGGSSTLMARHLGNTAVSVINKPSDGTQRKIINGVGFVSLSDPGTLETIKIIPSSEYVFKNNPINLSVIGYDEFYNPVIIETKNIVWSVEGVNGVWTTNQFTPTTAGSYKLTCYYQGKSTTVSLKSLDKPIDLSVTPRIMSLDYNQKGRFVVKGLDISGFEGTINESDVVYTVEKPELGAFIKGEFNAGTKTGITKVTISVGGRNTTAYVAVGNEEVTYKLFDKVVYENRGYPEEKVTLEITKDIKTFFDTDQSYRFDYNFQSSPDAQAGYMMLDNVKIESKTDILGIQLYGNESGHGFKGKVVDANGKSATITFTDNINWTGWKKLTADIPSDLVYPIKLDRLYVIAMQQMGLFNGIIYVDSLSLTTRLETSQLRFDSEGYISDPLMVSVKPVGSKEIKVFGATSGRNRLLDNVLLEKVYETMNKADYSIFAGNTKIDTSKISVPTNIWNNSFDNTSMSGIKVIHLGTDSGGLRNTDYNQFTELDKLLSATSENTIIIVANRNPLINFSDKKEGELVHQILKKYQTKTGKTIFYISAHGYETEVVLKDSIRYIDISGLWYQINDRYVDLNKTFNSLSFYIKNGEVSYQLESLYPLVEIN